MSITYCCNPVCPNPHNPPGMVFCQYCGSRLRLGDRYGAYSAVGGGGSSRTYLAVDTRQMFDSRCIIKAFVQGGDGVEAAMDGLRRDAALLDVVGQHPQIPTLYAYFERGHQQYLVQEFIEGRHLLNHLVEDGSFHEDQIRALLQDLLPVLQFLHDHQVIHRDVKPSNIIRRSLDQRLVLVDFGAMKHATQSALAQTGTVMGSADYIAPEQLLGRALFASDLYSLGVTCVHLLTGLHPFELYDGSSSQWFWRSVSGPVSASLVRVLNRLLERNASDRYPSAQAVLQDLGLEPAQPWLPAVPPRVELPAIAPPWEEVQVLQTHTPVNAMALTADGRTLISGGNDGAIQVWDTETGHLRHRIDVHAGAVTVLALSPDGQMVIGGGWDHTLGSWNLATGAIGHTLQGHTQGITGLILDAHPTQVISSSRDRTIRLWDWHQGLELQQWTGHRAAIEAIALTQDGRTLVSGDAAGQVWVWQRQPQERLRILSGHRAAVSALALSPDGETLISGGWDMTLQGRHLATGGVRLRLRGHLLPVACMALTQAGTLLWTGSHDGTVMAWDLPAGQSRITLRGHLAAVTAIAIPPDASLLASGSRDGTIRLWRPSNEEFSGIH